MPVYRQGSLDGLCGLYAVVNALSRVFRGIDANALTEWLVLALEQRDGLVAAFLKGTNRTDVSWLLWHASAFCEETLGHQLNVASPHWSRRPHSHRQFVRMVQDALEQHYVPLVGFRCAEGGHWAVVAGVDGNRFRFADSAVGGTRLAPTSTVTGSSRPSRILHIEAGCTFLLGQGAMSH